MAVDVVSDFLRQQILIERAIVTYRSLSRSLDLHINDAKNALMTFRGLHTDDIPAMRTTYLVSGTVTPFQTIATKKFGEESKDAANAMDEALVPRFRMTVVEEQALDAVLGGFQEVSSIHVYSLSATRVVDPTILTEPTNSIREKDNIHTSTRGASFGRVISAEIKVGKPSKIKKAATSNPDPAATHQEPKAKAESLKKSNSLQTLLESNDGEVGARASAGQGVSGQHQQASPPVTSSAEARRASFFAPRTQIKTKNDQAPKVEHAEFTEHAKELKSVASREGSKPVRLQKRVVLSDEEPDEQPKRPGKKRKSIADEDTADERSLKAMMDIDDETVSRASGNATGGVPPKKSEEATHNQEAQETDEDAKPIEQDHSQGQYIDKKPRKPRKQAAKHKDTPVDSKGRKKRKVTKSRKEKDRKGRTITVDYSSWESTSEDEGPPGPPATIDQTSKSQSEKDQSGKLNDNISSTSAQAKSQAKGSTKSSDLRGFFTPKAG